ncbi:hypothetical protein [Nocardioides sp.]|uniref:hypothetical protein n=1 Tax=Nocardioides sp. TaxID=35761 RepID=UPI002B26E65F|nr:hypothetical protein [Nocardioides sp.]
MSQVLVRGATALLLVFIVVCLWWRLGGGEWQRVETPSMGARAPVGTLLWVAPVDADDLRAGDFITFQPPGTPTTYSHLVTAINDDGTLATEGVISGPDPWALSPGDVVGRVEATWHGVGWLVAAAPVLLIGGFLVAAARRLVRRPSRLPLTLVLGAVAFSVAITVYQPFIGAQQLGFTADEQGGAEATYVGTGLLPIRLEAGDQADAVVLSAGSVGSVHVQDSDQEGLVSVSLSPAVPLWWWAPLVGACFVPATAAGLRTRRESRGRASAAGCHRRPRASCP